MIHNELTGESTGSRIAAAESAAAINATSAAQRIAVFHSTSRGCGGGRAPVVVDSSPAAEVSP
jgi:hypothetical protein